MPYVTERKGEETLIAAIEKREVDIVLGLTASGVFLRVLQRAEELGPLVTTISVGR